jgi:hypothetical protein
MVSIQMTTIGPGLLRSILSQAGVTVEELRAVL